jgi:hypothetical protein
VRIHRFAVPRLLEPCNFRCPKVPVARLALLLFALITPQTPGAVGDVVETIVPQAPTSENFFSVGLAFVGNNPDASRDGLYVNRNGDSTIYVISPLDGSLIQDRPPFDTMISEWPAAMSYDAKRNGLWIGTQKSVGGSGFGVCGDPAVVNADMPIYFWSFDDDSVTLMFTIPFGLTNPATGERFFKKCRLDGLVYDENELSSTSDDEIWFSDMVNRNVGVFGIDGLLLRGFDASTVDGSLTNSTGLAFGADKLYLTNDGVGDVFRANQTTDSLRVIDEDPSTPDAVDPLTSGNGWLTDMSCDPVTFAQIGKTVMWVRTSLNCILTQPFCDPRDDLLTAYEIEPGSCDSVPLGACCDASGAICRNYAGQAGCQGSWTEGVTCDQLTNPCFEAHMIVVLDRTGSMNTVRTETGETRCADAITAAEYDIRQFFDSNPPGSTLAIWTFAGSGVTPLTTGFVSEDDALAALNGLDPLGCTDWTPLAEAICEAVDFMAGEFPTAAPETLKVVISSDGEENNSDGLCLGPSAVGGTTCVDFTDGSWQRKVCDHVQGKATAIVRYWNDFNIGALAAGDSEMDMETGLLRAAGVSDALFFEALVEATGGSFQSVVDSSAAPLGQSAFGVTGACCLPVGSCQDATTEAECAVLGGIHRGESSTCAGLASPCVATIPTVSEWGLVMMVLLVVLAGTVILLQRRNAYTPYEAGWFDE